MLSKLGRPSGLAGFALTASGAHVRSSQGLNKQTEAGARTETVWSAGAARSVLPSDPHGPIKFVVDAQPRDVAVFTGANELRCWIIDVVRAPVQTIMEILGFQGQIAPPGILHAATPHRASSVH